MLKRFLKELLVGAFSVIAVMTCLTLPAFATDKYYDIDKYDVTATVLKNGDVLLDQKITYDFSGVFNGVYYNQDLAGIDGMSDPIITVTDEDGNRRVVTEGSNTSSSSTPHYTVNKSKTDYKFKVYYPAMSEEVTFHYNYRLKGVVKNYRDTAEINWKIIGAAWSEPLKNVTIKVVLPAKNVNKLQAWTHGPLSGNTEVDKKAGQVVMKVKKVPANTFVESHMVFPTSVTSDNPKVVNENKLEQIQKQEAKFAVEANRKRTLSLIVPVTVTSLLLAIGILIFGFSYRWFKRHPGHRVRKTPPVHNFEIPPYSAVEAQVILSRTVPDSKAFTAWLMELAAAGEVTITPEEQGKRNKKTYRITRTDKMTEVHRNNFLLNQLFNRVGRQSDDAVKDSFTVLDLKKYKDDDLAESFSTWQDDRYREVEDYGFFDQYNALIKIWSRFVIFCGSVFAIAAMIAVENFGLSGWFESTILISGVILIVASWWLGISQKRRLSPYTQAGEDAAGPIEGFKKMLKDIGKFERSEVGDLILWEQILPYAVAFDLADKVVAAMRVNFTDDELETGMDYYYPLLFASGYDNMLFSDVFEDNFSDVTEASSDSSISGGSGGFSGGSSGGFGGGSGGGAF